MAEFQLNGGDLIEAMLKQLPDVIAKKVTYSALHAGAKVIADDMREHAPVLKKPRKDRVAGALRDAITISRSKKATKNRANMIVGFKKPASRYAHLVEFGTEHAPAQPFIRPAIDKRGQEAIAKVGEIAGKGIEREARRLAGK